eukprot:PhM_4_TR18456/c0_g1_i4/m.17634
MGQSCFKPEPGASFIDKVEGVVPPDVVPSGGTSSRTDGTASRPPSQTASSLMLPGGGDSTKSTTTPTTVVQNMFGDCVAAPVTPLVSMLDAFGDEDDFEDSSNNNNNVVPYSPLHPPPRVSDGNNGDNNSTSSSRYSSSSSNSKKKYGTANQNLLVSPTTESVVCSDSADCDFTPPQFALEPSTISPKEALPPPSSTAATNVNHTSSTPSTPRRRDSDSRRTSIASSSQRFRPGWTLWRQPSLQQVGVEPPSPTPLFPQVADASPLNMSLSSNQQYQQQLQTQERHSLTLQSMSPKRLISHVRFSVLSNVETRRGTICLAASFSSSLDNETTISSSDINHSNQNRAHPRNGANAILVTELIRGYDDDGNKLLNEYAVLGDLGSGSYGKVKLALDTTTESPVAIKILKKARLQKAGTNARDEMEVMERLRHPNIVRLHAVIDDPSALKMYMVMEYVPAGTLNDVVSQRARELSAPGAFISDEEHVVFSETDNSTHTIVGDGDDHDNKHNNEDENSAPAEDLRQANSEHDTIFRTRFLDVLHGLQYLHNHNVIHMDIKP